MADRPDRESMLDALSRHRVFSGLSPHRLIPLLESAEFRQFDEDEIVFEQFHPATTFYLLCEGAATQARLGADRTKPVHQALLDWPGAVLGWSGFLPPFRYGSTLFAGAGTTALCWSHERLAEVFYADPSLAIRFFDLVHASAARHFDSLRRQRVAVNPAIFEPPEANRYAGRRPVVGRADSCLRRSAFFAAFDDDSIDQLSRSAVLESYAAGECIARQGEALDGLLLLGSGRCNLAIEDAVGETRAPFRRIRDRAALVVGLPTGDAGYIAEASAWAETDCWIYRLPAPNLKQLQNRNPEFGRAFQQRLLVRLAGLISAVEPVEADDADDADAVAISTMLANNQTRLPVTSDLFKIPHLLADRLTVGNAFAVLTRVQETGRYSERVLAGQCLQTIENLAAEHEFYQTIVETCRQIGESDESLPAEEVRAMCDDLTTQAFAHLDCRVDGLENLPARGSHVVVLNHISCPEYYELPNGYHFSFDTAFVSGLIWQRKGRSPIRVVRESPGAEFGHNIFYRRLDPITVPTIESGLTPADTDQFENLRRDAASRFLRTGKAALSSGTSLLICPEGQSQPEIQSPAYFHSGAFRLAAISRRPIVPVALAGFGRRYKDGPLVAIIGEPVTVAPGLADDRSALRDWIVNFHEDFIARVDIARRIAAEPARLRGTDGR